jgi:alginate O-acetyltransferase complex protein AlgI
MFFCSERYLLFFALVFTAYWSVPFARLRVYLLLAASFYFYASWNRWLALIVGASTVLDYLLARGMDSSGRPAVRKLLLGVSVVANLGLLCYFKYANFFLQSLEQALRACGATASLPLLKVILPIGISFYTFEAINYTVDVYRRRIRAETNLAHFLLFITFFPHLVAGPIVRSRDFLPQIRRRKHWSWARLHLGGQLVLLGLFKKMAIADRMAQFVDPVFADPTLYSTGAVWVAVLAYSLQIYCDFSGYTDLALGSAHMLGYKLAPNFAMPYLSANVSEFWRRWHISLSSWLRDYLFIPLGGSRGGPWQTGRNLLITMTLGGLWHGANWTFVAWGALHGAYLVAHRGFRSVCDRSRLATRCLVALPARAGFVALTFLTVSLTWVFFRAPTFALAQDVFRRLGAPYYSRPLFLTKTLLRHPSFGGAADWFWGLLAPCGGQPVPLDVGLFWLLALATLVCHALSATGVWRKTAIRLPAPVLGVGYGVCLALCLLLTPDAEEKVFIYFQF